MKNSKKGISLIVLIITIVVIIILAAAVILTIGNNNPVESANEAVKLNDAANVKDAVTMYVYSYMADHNGESPIAAAGATLTKDPTEPSNTATPESARYPKTKINWADIGISKDLGAGWSVDKNGVVTVPADYQPKAK